MMITILSPEERKRKIEEMHLKWEWLEVKLEEQEDTEQRRERIRNQAGARRTTKQDKKRRKKDDHDEWLSWRWVAAKLEDGEEDRHARIKGKANERAVARKARKDAEWQAYLEYRRRWEEVEEVGRR